MKWREWEGLGLGGSELKIMYTPSHTDDTTDLVTAIQQAGWADRRAAVEAAHVTTLRTGWYGYVTGEYTPYVCDDNGVALIGDDQLVEIAMPFTWVLVD
jgi:hypothetical protein